MNELPEEYLQWINNIKDKIQSAQIKAAISVNSQLIALYWELGKMIAEKQEKNGWGTGLINKMAVDLKRGLTNTHGFSRSNLYNIRQFYLFYRNNSFVHQAGGLLKMDNDIKQDTDKMESDENIHQAGGHPEIPQVLLQIPWRHHVLIINKLKQIDEAFFYVNKVVENNWSRNILELQIRNNLHKRQGKAVSNFETTLPAYHSDLATETLKNPYVFDFLTLEENVQEQELERRLTDNITQLLLELGKGFAYLGRQYPIFIGG